MNLLYITHHRRFKTFARSGLFARLMVEAGHDVTVLCTADTSRWSHIKSQVDGVRYIEAADLLPGQLRSGWDPASINRRSRLIMNEKFDLVHVFETRPATIYPALKYIRKFDVPLVMDWNDWWGRGGLIRELRPRWYQVVFEGFETYYEEHFRTRARATTVISHALGERAVGLGVPAETIHWVPGAANTELFMPADARAARIELNLPADAFLMGFSAMDVLNDAEFVFAAAKRVIHDVPQARLVMMGRNLPALHSLANQYGIQEQFTHLGLFPQASLPRPLAAMDVFLLPYTMRVSNIGRWPNKVGDYLAMGRPTVTNPVGEMNWLFQDGKGGVLADETPEAFAAAIIALARDPEHCRLLGRQARQKAEQTLARSHIERRLRSAYEQVMSDNPT
jgi:glycosyltransferase involved in cell wall biosynthesis